MVLPGLISLYQLSVLYNAEISELYPDVFEVVRKDIDEKLNVLEKKKLIDEFSHIIHKTVQ